MMNAVLCQRTRASFDLYLDGDMDAETELLVTGHLVDCSACAAALGDDARLGEAVARAFAAAPALGHRHLRWRAAASAAAIVAFSAAAWTLGRWSAEPTSGPTIIVKNHYSEEAGPTPDAITVAYDAADALRPIETDPHAMFLPVAVIDRALIEHERNALSAEVGRAEASRMQVEAQLDALRPPNGAAPSAEAIVEAFATRAHGEMAKGRIPGEMYRRAHAIGRMLRSDAEAAWPAFAAWLKAADAPAERRLALRLLAQVGGSNALDTFAAEVRTPGVRDAAIDGLIGCRSARALATVADIHRAAGNDFDLRVRAAGAMVRLGDISAMDELAAAFRKDTTERTLRKRIIFDLAAGAPHRSAALLTEFVGARDVLDQHDRSSLACCLASVGAAARPVIDALKVGADARTIASIERSVDR